MWVNEVADTKENKHIEPPKKLFLFEQANDAWMSWSGSEDDLREFLNGSGIKAYEYSLTEKVIST